MHNLLHLCLNVLSGLQYGSNQAAIQDGVRSRMRPKRQGNSAFQCFGYTSGVPEVLALEWRLKFLSAGFLSAVAHMSKAPGIPYLVEQCRFHHKQYSSVARLL